MDWKARTATVACGDTRRTFGLKTDGLSPYGPSYMHLQSVAEAHDPKGVYFRSFKMTAED